MSAPRPTARSTSGPPHPWVGAVVADMLDRTTANWPHNVAIVDGDTSLTFAELCDLRDRLAAELHQLGVADGTHVALYLGEGWRNVVALYALLYLGARVVPLNLAWEASELQFALNKAEVEVLIAGSTYRSVNLTDKLRAIGVNGFGPCEVASSPSLRSVISADPRSDASHSLDSMLALRIVGSAPRGTNQTALMIFTSGSTSTPKAALIRQEAALGTSYCFGERLGLDESDRLLNVLPLYHCGGLIAALLGCHQRGATVYLFEGLDVDRMATVLSDARCTVMIGFDIINMRVIAELKARHVAVPITKMQVTSSGTYDEMRELGVRAVMCFALTESSNMVSITDPTEDESERYSNGSPLPGVDVRISDYETRQPLPAGAPGEICFRGWNLIDGYFRDPERTREAFDEDGFFHTGDYGWLDADGRLYYRGRYAMMIKTGGENVSEVEVEAFLIANIPGIVNAAVVGVTDPMWGEVVTAFVEVTEPFDEEAIRTVCRGKLARFKIPKHVFEMSADAWPVTPTGKLKKDDLRARASALVSSRV